MSKELTRSIVVKPRGIGRAALAAGLMLIGPVAGHAQYYPETLPWARHQAPYERSVPNYPDRQGCIAQCEFDLNPCDPPLIKHADGRCTLKD
jgi:hypothetical protein